MSSLKTFLWAGLAGVWLAGSALAQQDLLRHFATCTGRLSAQMEHQWLIGDQGSSRTEALRDEIVGLLDAVTTHASASRALGARIDAKHAHAALLQVASFGRDRRTATHAMNLALQQVAVCRRLIRKHPA